MSTSQEAESVAVRPYSSVPVTVAVLGSGSSSNPVIVYVPVSISLAPASRKRSSAMMPKTSSTTSVVRSTSPVLVTLYV